MLGTDRSAHAEKVKVAVIGCGFIAKVRHIPAFKKMHRHVDLCAVFDLNESLARKTSHKRFDMDFSLKPDTPEFKSAKSVLRTD